MKLLSIVLASSLVSCVLGGLLGPTNDPKRRQSDIPIFCKSLPLPSLDTDTFTSKLQPYLEQVDEKVQEALKEDNSTGGAVLSVVYKNKTIWTKGYGLIDISSESAGVYIHKCIAIDFQYLSVVGYLKRQ